VAVSLLRGGKRSNVVYAVYVKRKQEHTTVKTSRDDGGVVIGVVCPVFAPLTLLQP
jgi:hypothetical protein